MSTMTETIKDEALFIASEDDCQVSVTRLNGDRLFILVTKTA